MEKTWKPTAAGILNIVAGVVGLIAVLGLIIAIIVVGSSFMFWQAIPEIAPGVNAPFVQSILLIIAIPLAIVSILALVGGVYALQRKIWGLALAGSIASILASIPLLGGLPVGITATVLMALSKDEFE